MMCLQEIYLGELQLAAQIREQQEKSQKEKAAKGIEIIPGLYVCVVCECICILIHT